MKTLAEGVKVTDGALTQIVVRAAEAVDGARVRRPRRKVEVEIADGVARVELELAVAYGKVLPEVARAVQREVADALSRMCDVAVDAVDVSVEELE
ncbi:MAG: Asp23/Gls24 family envelope stress response protein [Actinobacteria bacterium]|nr:MAG: Asp23/Gls24 family envelope stress response protein [Actinomycetota bacterium]